MEGEWYQILDTLVNKVWHFSLVDGGELRTFLCDPMHTLRSSGYTPSLKKVVLAGFLVVIHQTIWLLPYISFSVYRVLYMSMLPCNCHDWQEAETVRGATTWCNNYPVPTLTCTSESHHSSHGTLRIMSCIRWA